MSTKSTLGSFKVNVNKKTIAECAFQRAIWLTGKSKLGKRTVKWLDIELPVDGRKAARGKCVDLIGVDKSTGTYVLCELKFRRSSDNGATASAIQQLCEYRDLIHANKCKLREINHHENCRQPFDWRDVDSDKTILVVAANEKYWREHRKINVPDNIECYSLPVPPDAFAQQSNKSSNATYQPALDANQNKWSRV